MATINGISIGKRRVSKFPGRNKGTLRPDRKIKRQLEASARQAEFDKLTPHQKYGKTGMLRYLEEA